MDIYERNGNVFLIFDDKIIENFSSKKKKNIYSKLKDKKKYSSVLNNLHITADEDSKLHNKRKIAKTFNPSLGGILLIKNEEICDIEDNALLEEFDKLCKLIENDYGLNIFNYMLNEIYEEERQEKYFEIETFNYNFISHRAVKSNLVSDFVKELNNFIENNFFKNIKKINKKAETNIENNAKYNKIHKPDKIKKNKTEYSQHNYNQHNDNIVSKKKNNDNAAEYTNNHNEENLRSTSLESKPLRTETVKNAAGLNSKSVVIPKTESIAKSKFEIILETAKAIAAENTESKLLTDIHSEINLISLSWSSLSPKDTAPILEEGVPIEINNSSWIRMYFQKPRVRKIVWRLRDKPDADNLKPLLRVYADENMLWYETLDSLTGDKYIILSEDIELSRVWAELGYVAETNEFIFIARTPLWPPECLFKSSPVKYSLKKSLNNKICFIGATENLPEQNNLVNTAFTSSGGGFYVE
jgi:hypothetical protein